MAINNWIGQKFISNQILNPLIHQITNISKVHKIIFLLNKYSNNNYFFKKLQYDMNLSNIQGVPKKTPSCLWRLITLVWKQLFGQVGTVLESSGYELSFETKKSRIMLKHLWEKRVWSWLPYRKTWHYCITDIHR